MFNADILSSLYDDLRLEFIYARCRFLLTVEIKFKKNSDINSTYIKYSYDIVNVGRRHYECIVRFSKQRFPLSVDQDQPISVFITNKIILLKVSFRCT